MNAQTATASTIAHSCSGNAVNDVLHPNALRHQVVALAGGLGFDLCRFTRAQAPQHAREFREWLANGHAGEMNYLARNAERRCDPAQVLPGAKTVIVLAMNYFQGNQLPGRVGVSPAGFGVAPKQSLARSKVRNGETPLPAGETPTLPGRKNGRIARYAWGKDYHPLMEGKLRELDEFLRAHGGIQKCYVDTGPVLERDYAAAAGIGWQGKSTMLLNRQLGTWFFLAQILTTLEFDPDAPQPNRCGSCTRCIDACPTSAITPHRLDARRCISYLTIELKGAIPEELRPLIGDRIYGCDECLDVCPWNRFARTSRETAFQMTPEIAAMRLRDYLRLDEEGFRRLFRNSPIRRTKRSGLLRNVCVALGNVGTSDDLPALRQAAVDPEPLIAEHARWAIQQIERRFMSSRAPSRDPAMLL